MGRSNRQISGAKQQCAQSVVIKSKSQEELAQIISSYGGNPNLYLDLEEVVFNSIHTLWKSLKRPPTVTEIVSNIGVKKSKFYKIICTLKGKGRIISPQPGLYIPIKD